ncbi:MAG: helix-turn-helix transcriptional regulator [Erysipelothrix sp.]|jgi:DNA-binding PadR family transcriptional regulator|nr:helix-turn-helix transcriptional regulator [Erysipelothrix sp.]
MKEIVDGLLLELRRGVLILGVLSQLDQKEYGYSLIQKLQIHKFDIEAGTLYPLLRRLEKQGLLESSWELIENRPRRYYQISDQGKIVLEQLKTEYFSLNTIMVELTKGGQQ